MKINKVKSVERTIKESLTESTSASSISRMAYVIDYLYSHSQNNYDKATWHAIIDAHNCFDGSGNVVNETRFIRTCRDLCDTMAYHNKHLNKVQWDMWQELEDLVKTVSINESYEDSFEDDDYIIWAENGGILGTPYSNYKARIRDANKVTNFTKQGFTSAEQAKKYMLKYGKGATKVKNLKESKGLLKEDTHGFIYGLSVQDLEDANKWASAFQKEYLPYVSAVYDTSKWYGFMAVVDTNNKGNIYIDFGTDKYGDKGGTPQQAIERYEKHWIQDKASYELITDTISSMDVDSKSVGVKIYKRTTNENYWDYKVLVVTKIDRQASAPYYFESMKEGWAHFTYRSGANPYIAKTDKEKQRILKKYKGKVKQTGDTSYEIDDTDSDTGKFTLSESSTRGNYGHTGPFWYFTTHGLGPGTLPKDVCVVDSQEGQNRKGTNGLFIALDGVLTSEELEYYDLIELSPDNSSTTVEESLDTDYASLLKGLTDGKTLEFKITSIFDYDRLKVKRNPKYADRFILWNEKSTTGETANEEPYSTFSNAIYWLKDGCATLCEGLKGNNNMKLEKPRRLTESNNNSLDIIIDYFRSNYGGGPYDDEFIDIAGNIIDRALSNISEMLSVDQDVTDTPDEFRGMLEEAVMDAMDDALIYTEDQWTLMQFYQEPSEADFDEAWSMCMNDCTNILEDLT